MDTTLAPNTRRASLTWLFIFLILGALATPAAELLHTDFSNTAALRFHGQASRVNTGDGPVLRLVPSVTWATGSAFTTNQFSVAQFSAYFTFRVAGLPSDIFPADGFVFVIKSSNEVLGDNGGYLGYTRSSRPGITNSVGVEFDLMTNIEFEDGAGSHVGINWGGLLRGGASTSPITGDFWRGDRWHAWVDYNGIRMQVRVSTNGLRPALPQLDRALNVTNELRSDRGFIGFTAATGLGRVAFDLLSWQYVGRYDPIVVIGQPASAFTELSIFAQPMPGFATNRAPASFGVGVVGSLPLSYQWQFNGADLPGATNTMLSLPSVTAAHIGNYRVRVADATSSRWSTEQPLLLVAPERLIRFGDTWRFADFGTNPSPSWTHVDFDDAAWRAGPGQLGYGDGDEATVVSFGSSTANRHITTYFRRTFVVPDPDDLLSLRARLVRDDGAVIHVNGREATRYLMPPGSISPSTRAVWAVAGVEETTPIEFPLPVSLLQAGTNVIAVEIHQAESDSSDISFDLELTALVEMPRLVLQRDPGGQWSARWPARLGGVRVQSTSSLIAPVVWTLVSGTIDVDDGVAVLPLSVLTGPAHYYRLATP